jgi:hypothetical protein
MLLGLLLVAAALLFVGAGAEAAGPNIAPVCLARSFQGGPASEPLATSKLFFPLQNSPCNYPFQVPFQNDWLGSGHADRTAAAFNYNRWNQAGVIPTSCAKCHSTHGYRDFLGDDGTAEGVVDNAAPVGSTVECIACHNDKTIHKTSVTFPSGITLNDLGDESRCMECHQGRSSKATVDNLVAPLADADVVSPTLSFPNIHYFAAAVSLYGTQVQGGYQYRGMSYDAKFAHVESYATCIECHNPHELELEINECKSCHPNVNSAADFGDIRMAGSLGDYDGDGDKTEGVSEEIDGLRAMLYTAIRSYANQVSQAPIAYSSAAHPYWFRDANDNGMVDAGETTAYNAFTARLIKAAYNYQVAAKDPGQFAHGGKYIIQLLHDSIADLNPKINPPVDLANAWRGDPGHFNGSEEAFRHWDAAGPNENPPRAAYTVPAGCTKCHTAEGVPFFIENGVNIKGEASNGLMCSTCHKNLTPNYERYTVNTVTFPSGAAVSLPDKDANLCLLCHQGRESSVSVNNAIVGKDLDTPAASLRFRNVHYFAAGATLFGNDVKGIYQYDGKNYLGRNIHGPGIATYDACTECHNTHELEVKVDKCSTCHLGISSNEDLKNIRGAFGGNQGSNVDYDGDGSKTEGIYGEIETMAAKLYTALQAYGVAVGFPIAYDGAAYPYFFNDTNGNGVVDPEEATSANGYNHFTPRSLRTAYNYQYVQKDPGQFAHNAKYVLQALYDGLEDLGQRVTVDMTGLVRP